MANANLNFIRVPDANIETVHLRAKCAVLEWIH